MYIFGGVTKDIQTAIASADGGSATVVQQNERSKARVIQSIADVRKGLQQLETSFGSSPVLKTYYPNLAGVGDIGVAAEKSAQAARYDQCGKSLLQVVDKLTDALAAMK